MSIGVREAEFACAPEFEPEFVDEMDELETVVDRSQQGNGPPGRTVPEVLDRVQVAIDTQRECLRYAERYPKR